MTDAVRNVVFNIKTVYDKANEQASLAVAKVEEQSRRRVTAVVEHEEKRRTEIVEREQSKRVALIERQEKAFTAANRRATAGVLQAAEGVSSLTRNLVILGVSGNKELDKVANTILKVVVGFDALRQTVRVIEGGTRAWQAYKEAAAAAGVAGASAGAGSGVAGGAAGSGLVGGAALTIGAATAAIGSLGLVIWELGEIASGTSHKVGSVTNTIAEAEVGAWAWLREHSAIAYALGEDDPLGRKKTDRMQTAADQTTILRGQQQEWQRNNFANKRQIETMRRDARLQALDAGPFGDSRDRLAANQSQLNEIAGELGPARARQSLLANTGNIAGRQDAEARVTELLNRQLELTRERQRIEVDVVREKIAGAQAAEQSAHAERQSTMDRLEAMRDQNRSASERFAMMPPAIQQEVSRIQSKVASGGDLNLEEAKLLSPFRELGENASAIARAFDKISGSRFVEMLENSGQAGRMRSNEANATEASLMEGIQRQHATDLNAQAKSMASAVNLAMKLIKEELVETFNATIGTNEARKSQAAAGLRASQRGGYGGAWGPGT